MAMTINDITLNSRLVRNKPGRWVVYSSFICLLLPNRMIKPQQSRKTIPIRSSQGNSGQRNFSFIGHGSMAAGLQALPIEASYIIPAEVEGMSSSSLLLNGDWQFRFAPQGKWNTVQVPGELAMQGYAIEHDTPYLYRKSFTLPAHHQRQ